jgi:hypothetical protein
MGVDGDGENLNDFQHGRILRTHNALLVVAGLALCPLWVRLGFRE